MVAKTQSTAVTAEPEMATHLYELVRDRAAAHPTAIALGSEQGLTWRTVDSAELLERVDRLADELAAVGIKVGDRVVLWVPNTWRTPVYLFAIWKLGAIFVPFDREMNPAAGARIIETVEPRVILAGYGEQPEWGKGQTLTEWWEPGSKPDAPSAATAWTRPAEELAAIFFTSGTTGDPKGCMITHANLSSQVDALGDIIPLDTSCRLAGILPLSHLFELVCGMLYPLASGAAIHYIPSRRGPDILRVLSEQQITHMTAVPQLLTLMGDALDSQLRDKLPGPIYRALNGLAERVPMALRRRLFFIVHRKLGGNLRMLASGGAALPAETQRGWERLGVRVVQGYGASECSPVIACGKADGSTPIGSVGQSIEGTDVKLNPEGELLVKGQNVMRGYWKDPQRTDEVIHDGWYATGDLGSIDQDGNIRLAGRAKDLIVLPSGMNVWPQDVEDTFRAHPAVKDAAVITVPSPTGGATLHAYLIPSGANTDLVSIVAASNGRLAQHQRVATAAWWEDAGFPVTSTLKVRRHLLPVPEVEVAVVVDSVLASDDPVGQAIAAAARVASVRPEQTLGALGLDSLALVDLALGLEEKTGKMVGDQDLSLDMTVEQVREFMAGAAAGEGGEARLAETLVSARQSLWPYTWGRAFRFLGFPISLLYRFAVTRTLVLGAEQLSRLPPRVIVAGTHHSFPDMPLVRQGLRKTPARGLAGRLIVATAAQGFGEAGLAHLYAKLAFGLYPLRQYGDRDVSLRGLASLAAAGNPVLIFPQGTHSTSAEEQADDPRVRFKPGVAHLASALDAVVVPFGLAGTEEVMPPAPDPSGGMAIAGVPIFIKRGPLAIAFGAPLGLDPAESMQEFAARLQAACYRLTRQAEEALVA